jgi:ABC-type molybdate transport system substrate-binding protein
VIRRTSRVTTLGGGVAPGVALSFGIAWHADTQTRIHRLIWSPVRISPSKALALVVALLATAPLAACGGNTGVGGERNAPNSIVVLADASLKDAFTQIGTRFEADNPGQSVSFTYGSSSSLAQKALAGDPGDVLTTADRPNMDSTTKVQLDEPTVVARKGQAMYAMAPLTQAKNSTIAKDFISYVREPAAQTILQANGFQAP